jgi:hypothetical protein
MADHVAQLEPLAEQVRQEVVRHGLEWEDLPQTLRVQGERDRLPDETQARVIDAAETVVRDGGVPDDVGAFRELVHEVSSLFNVEIDASPLDSSWRRALRFAPKVVAVVLFAIVTYFLLGGLLGGYSHLAPNRWVAMGLFVFLVALLACVEALHISVTLLRLKDLNGVRDEFPRTFKAHEIFRHEAGTERFLAGRQLFVIITVFFAAQLTSFDAMTNYPGTHTQIPSWFHTVFLKQGIVGALFILWEGQLTPQFYANRRPRHFMNNWVISKLFSAALFMEAIGVTKPGGWLAARVAPEPAIPVSAEERYRQAIEEIDGSGAVGVKKVWSISDGAAAHLDCDVSYRFELDGIQEARDDSIAIHGSVEGVRGEANLLGLDGASRELDATGPTLDHGEDGAVVVAQTAQPRYGPFRKGDVLLMHTELDFARSAGLDQVSITEPTQYLLFRVELGGSPRAIRGARVQGFRIGETPTAAALVGQRPMLDRDLELTQTEDGTPCYEFTVLYPPPNSHYLVAWEADYALS